MLNLRLRRPSPTGTHHAPCPPRPAHLGPLCQFEVKATAGDKLAAKGELVLAITST